VFLAVSIDKSALCWLGFPALYSALIVGSCFGHTTDKETEHLAKYEATVSASDNRLSACASPFSFRSTFCNRGRYTGVGNMWGLLAVIRIQCLFRSLLGWAWPEGGENIINASASPSAVATSLKPPPPNCMEESQCKKISTSLVQPLRCTKQAQYEPWELKITSDSSTVETGFLSPFNSLPQKDLMIFSR